MKKNLTAVAVMGLLLLLAGCATTIGRDYDPATISHFVAGQTTLEQVVAALGEPQERETESDGSVRLHYQYIKSGSSLAYFVPGAPTKANVDDKDTYLYFVHDKYERAETNQSHM